MAIDFNSALLDPSTPISAIDFGSYLAGDQTYQAAINAIAASRQSDLDSLNATREAGLIRYGEVPTNPDGSVQNLGFDIPQSWADLAAQATRGGVSQVAQLAQAYLDNQSAVRGNLGERGTIRSGDYAYLTNRNLRARQVGQFNAQDTMMQGLNDAQKNYLALLSQLNSDQSSAGTDAFNRMVALINSAALRSAAIPPAAQDPVTPPLGPIGVQDITTTQGPGLDPNSGYSPRDPSNPTIPYTPVYVGDPAGSYEPKTASDTSAYSDVYNTPTSPSVPDTTPAPAAPSTFLQSNPSDAGGRSATVAPPAPVVHAAPKPAGYGGSATAGQVRRNNL